MKRIALLTSILMVLFSIAPRPTYSAAGDKDVLVALYDSTNGDGWANKDGWKTDPNHCFWYGVFCDESYNVISLDLHNNLLSGSIPPELGNLSHLQGLGLDYNYLSGPIPAELGNLSNLQILYLDNNNLSGPIPAEFGNLSSLQWLYLNNNQLNGPIPAELSNLTNLQRLYLSNNPVLVCWETQAALTWAQGLDNYIGPGVVCQFVHLPLVTR